MKNNNNNNNKICQDALESLQELKLEEVDELLGGAGHGVNTISAECRWNSLQAIFSCC